MLLAIALIVLPIVFDGQGSYQQQLSSRIPDPPVIEPLPEPMQIRPVIIGGTPADEIPSVEEVRAEFSATADAAAEAVAQSAPSADEIPDLAISQIIDEAINDVEVVTSTPAFVRQSLPELDGNGLPRGWSVRLGAFSDFNNAGNLVSDLQQKGYKAYTRDVSRDQGVLTAVFVGPWVDREQADRYQEILQDEYNMPVIVVEFEIDRI